MSGTMQLDLDAEREKEKKNRKEKPSMNTSQTGSYTEDKLS